MVNHLKNRPSKKVFPANKQILLRDKAINKIKKAFLPDEDILKIILIGSSVQGAFGKYEPPGFRNSLFSDFDFIFIVKDNYKIPVWLNKEPTGKPFSDNKLNLAYRNKKFIDNKYDVEIFFIKEKSLNDPTIIEEAENAGIPLKNKSKNKYLIIFNKNN